MRSQVAREEGVPGDAAEAAAAAAIARRTLKGKGKPGGGSGGGSDGGSDGIAGDEGWATVPDPAAYGAFSAGRLSAMAALANDPTVYVAQHVYTIPQRARRGAFFARLLAMGSGENSP